jgi:hypothetical protein
MSAAQRINCLSPLNANIYTKHTYIQTCMHTYIGTHVHTYIYTYMHAYIHRYICTYIHTYTYIHTDVHTYVHIYIRTYVCTYFMQLPYSTLTFCTKYLNRRFTFYKDVLSQISSGPYIKCRPHFTSSCVHHFLIAYCTKPINVRLELHATA